MLAKPLWELYSKPKVKKFTPGSLPEACTATLTVDCKQNRKRDQSQINHSLGRWFWTFSELWWKKHSLPFSCVVLTCPQHVGGLGVESSPHFWSLVDQCKQVTEGSSRSRAQRMHTFWQECDPGQVNANCATGQLPSSTHPSTSPVKFLLV